MVIAVNPPLGKRPPSHPGEIVADILDALRISRRQAARALHVSPTTIVNVIAKKSSVTSKMALRFGCLFGNGPEIWLNLQRDYDIWHDGQKMKAELATIKPIKMDLLNGNSGQSSSWHSVP